MAGLFALCGDVKHDDYDYLRNLLIGESESSTSAFSLFKSIIPKAVEVILFQAAELANIAFSKDPPVTSTEKNTLSKLIQGFDFVAYHDTVITVPEGFSGKYVPFVEDLLKMSLTLQGDTVKVLGGYCDELSKLLSNADARIAIRAHSEAYKYVRIEREEITSLMTRYFKHKNSASSRSRIGDVFTRTADITQLLQLEDRLLRARDDISLDKIKAASQHALALLKLVRDRITRGEITDVSIDVAKKVSEGAYEVGKYLESIGIFLFIVETTLGCIRNLRDDMSRLLIPTLKK